MFFVCVCNLGTNAGSTETLTGDANTVSNELVLLSRVTNGDSTDNITDRLIAGRAILGVIGSGLSSNEISDRNVFSFRTRSDDLDA